MGKIEVSSEEFNRAMMKKHHSEMVSAIRDIHIPEPKDNSALISKLDKTISELTKKMESLKTPNIVLPKQENNQKEIVNLLKELIKETKNLKAEIKTEEEPKEWEFTVIRNNFGFIQSVKAKAK
jgi:hypothetical protein